MQSEKVEKSGKKTWLIILIVVLALALIIGVFFLGRFFAGRSLTLTSKSPSPATSAVSSSPTSTPKASPNASSPTNQPSSTGWKVFKNESFGYQISYPEGATIEFADDIGLKDAGLTDNKICVKIKTDNWYVIISAQDGKTPYLCLRTGVGADYINNTPDQLTIMGKEYTASGMMFSSASMGLLDSFWFVSPTDSARIEYGIHIFPESDVSEETAHSTAKKVVESFEKI